MHVCSNIRELVRVSEYVFLCTKADDGRSVVRKIGQLLTKNQVLLTSISQVPLSEWETYTDTPVVKFIPSVTQSAKSGIVLVTFGSKFSPRGAEGVIQLFQQIASPQVVPEHQVRVSSDLTSCGPAFMSYLFQAWADAAAETGALDRAVAESMIKETVVGLGKLLDQGMTFQDVLNRVTVPGGVTDCGLAELGDVPFQMFQLLHRATRNFAHGQTEPPVPSAEAAISD
jgi:competence protein ComER